jgi:hypothetical protein
MRRICVFGLLLAVLAACGPDDDQGTVCKGDGSLPPAGSECTMEGAVCEPPAILCGKAPYMQCEGGVWVEKPGSPCGNEGGDVSSGDTGSLTSSSGGTGP